jgi:hypothetical protein
MTGLIAEDVLLLLLDDESGKLTERTYLDVALGGALLTDLALREAVELPPKVSFWKTPRVTAVTGAGLEDPLLASSLALIAARPRTAQDLVKRLGKAGRGELFTRLVDQGQVGIERGSVLGVFSTTRYPAADPAYEDQLRAEVTAALVEGQSPDERTAAVIAVLSAIDRAHKVIDRHGLSRGDVKRRAKEIAEGDWAAKAVRDAVRAAQSAMTAAASSAAVAGSAGSS